MELDSVKSDILSKRGQLFRFQDDSILEEEVGYDVIK